MASKGEQNIVQHWKHKAALREWVTHGGVADDRLEDLGRLQRRHDRRKRVCTQRGRQTSEPSGNAARACD